MILINQMLVFLLMMIVGVICRKINILNDDSVKAISGLVVNVANPAMILSAGISSESRVSIEGVIVIMTVYVIFFVAMVILSYPVNYLLRTKDSEKGAYAAMLAFSNLAFMGMPLVMAISGETALLYTSLSAFPFSIFLYTYGIHMIKKGAGASAGKMSAGSVVKGIFNVGVIICIISFALYLTGIQFPEPVTKTVDTLGSMTAPLSMIVIGYSIGGTGMKSLFTDVRLLVFSAIKLLAVPLGGMLIVMRFIDDPNILIVSFVAMSTPVANMTSMLAQHYGTNAEITSKGVALTTILSVITIPLNGMILGLFTL